MAAVDKIEDQRKPEDFIGHRNRIAASSVIPTGMAVFLLVKLWDVLTFAGGKIGLSAIPNIRKNPVLVDRTAPGFS